MAFAINLTVDDALSALIERGYARLAALQVPDHDLVTQYGPCITVLVLDDTLLTETVARTLELRLPQLAAFPVAVTEPGIIPGTPPTLGLRVDPTPPLLALHAALYSEFPEDRVHLHYRPAYWQPHLKLANVRQDHAAAARLLDAAGALPPAQPGHATGLELVRYPPVQSVWQARLK